MGMKQFPNLLTQLMPGWRGSVVCVGLGPYIRCCAHSCYYWPLNLRLLPTQNNHPDGCHCTHPTAALAISSDGATRGWQAAAGICHIGDGSQQCGRSRASRVCKAALLLSGVAALLLGDVAGGGPGGSLLVLLLARATMVLPLHRGCCCAGMHLLLGVRLLAPPP